MRSPLLVLAALLSLGSMSCKGMAQGPQRRTIERQTAFDRAVHLNRSININRWFGRSSPAALTELTNYVTPTEAKEIHDWGFTAVRLAVREPFLFVASTNATRLDPAKLQLLDSAIARLNAAGLMVVVDFHSKERKKHEVDADYRGRMIQYWRLLARHLAVKSDPDKVYLELLNEPRFKNNPSGWNALQLRLYRVVRHEAPHHTILATSIDYSDPQTFPQLASLPDDNVIYTFHTYDPVAFTHQGASYLVDDLRQINGLPWPADKDCTAPIRRFARDQAATQYIQNYCTSGWNAIKFADYLKPAVEWARERDVPLFVGEFGARAGAMPEADRLAWLSMARAYFEKERLPWALWSYDDCYGLSLRVQGACPAGPEHKVSWPEGWQRACRTMGAIGLKPLDCAVGRSQPSMFRHPDEREKVIGQPDE